MDSKDKFLLQLADTAFVQSHRLQETVGHAPELEIEMALCNIGLDLLGQSRFLYQMVAEKIENCSEDDLAFGRDSWDIYNLLLAEELNGDFDTIIAKNFYLANFTYLLYHYLLKSEDEKIKAFAIKSLKELEYHKEYLDAWVVRLGDGTDYSHQKMQDSINNYWEYIGEFFTLVDYEKELESADFPINWDDLKRDWHQNIAAVLSEATLETPTESWSHTGGKIGRHSEHHGYILSQTRYIQSCYPDLNW